MNEVIKLLRSFCPFQWKDTFGFPRPTHANYSSVFPRVAISERELEKTRSTFLQSKK